MLIGCESVCPLLLLSSREREWALASLMVLAVASVAPVLGAGMPGLAAGPSLLSHSERLASV